MFSSRLSMSFSDFKRAYASFISICSGQASSTTLKRTGLALATATAVRAALKAGVGPS